MTPTNEHNNISQHPMVANPAPVRVVPPDQISPRDVMLRIFGLKDVFRRYWILIVGLVVVGGIIGEIIEVVKKRNPLYNAAILFNLGGGSTSSSGFGDLGALMNAFGSSAPDANIFVGDNFMIYAKSRPVIEKTLMKTVKIKGNDTLLVNYYIRHSGIRDQEWEKDDTLRRFYFDQAKAPEVYNKQEINAMAGIVTRIKTGEIAVTQPERKSSFMELRGSMEDEYLVKVFLENHLKTIEEDYQKKQTKKTREMLSILKHRTDSLASLLNGTENQLARTIDQNLQVIAAEARVQETKLSRSSQFLSTQYFSALSQEDNMRLSLVKESPLFTEVEPISLPLYKETVTSLAMEGGLILGLIVSLLIIFVRETYRSVMQEG